MKEEKPKIVAAVLGCGVIGAGWVEVFIANGIRVQAWDPGPDTRSRLEAIARRHGGALEFYNNPTEAVLGAVFIQESGPENLQHKRNLFAAIAPSVSRNAVVASSTSTFLPSDLQEGSCFADQILVGHPFNPAHILPLVEVVGGVATSEISIGNAMAFYRSLGKHPIRLHRERKGHLANRLQAALWREAVDAVACGQASVEDVDAAVTLALGPRWAIMGPFETFHLGGGTGGLAQFLAHLGPPFESLWDDAHRPTVTEELKKHLAQAISEALGGRPHEELSADRDRKLEAVLSIVLAQRQPEIGSSRSQPSVDARS
jgi:carnitine 3-dehydrogenase